MQQQISAIALKVKSVFISKW